MNPQQGFSFDPDPLDFGGQSAFSFSQPESQHSRDQRERSRRHEAEEAARRKREREQAQREQARRDEQAKQDESRRRQEHSGSRARHTMTWEAACEVLGVSHGASKGEIRKAWAKLAKRHHPDVGGDAEMLKRINAAYNQLKGGRV